MPFGGEYIEKIFLCQLFVYFFEKKNFFLQNCGAETNIWKCLKRIVELKQDHLTARKEAEKKVLRTAIHFLTDVIAELETFVDRPYRFMSTLEQDLKCLMLHNNETMEREWIYATR